ncbi:hypothetical protein AGMMS50276_10510 [Synergistales bacterium]|nr:hypothetical protein AGMMS50276_10510 [Synergistales bacterium]
MGSIKFLRVAALLLFIVIGATSAARGDVKIYPGFNSVTVGKGNTPSVNDGGGPALKDVTTIGFAGKQWNVIGYNGTGIASKAGTMTLLLSNGYEFAISAFGSNNNYSGSILQEAMNNAYSSANLGEQDVVTPHTLSDGIAGPEIQNARFWPLSTEEAKDVAFYVREFSTGWWLRSPVNGRVIIVADNGGIIATGILTSNTRAVRPAFILKLSNVIFTSAASGGKPTTVRSVLEDVGAPTGALKLTVSSSDLNLTSVTPISIENRTIKFDYSGSGAIVGKKLSAIISDDTGALKKYGVCSSHRLPIAARIFL